MTASQPEGRFFFRTAYRNDLEGTLAGLFASVALQAEKVYLIDDGELYGQDLADAAQRALLDNGVIVTRESVRRGTVDFSELVGEDRRARTRTWWASPGSTPRRRSSTASCATPATPASSAPWTPPPPCPASSSPWALRRRALSSPAAR